MMRLQLFGLLQLLVMIYALHRGGWPERWAAMLTSLALLAGWFLPFEGYVAAKQISHGRFAIDALLAVGLLAIALFAGRFWPIWLAGLQIVALGLYGVRLYDPAVVPIVYGRMIGYLGYPMLAIMAGGTWRFARRERDVGDTRAGA